MVTDGKPLLDIDDVAAMVGVHRKTIERCIKATEAHGAVRPFPGWKLLGRKQVITPEAVQAWIDSLPDA